MIQQHSLIGNVKVGMALHPVPSCGDARDESRGQVSACRESQCRDRLCGARCGSSIEESSYCYVQSVRRARKPHVVVVAESSQCIGQGVQSVLAIVGGVRLFWVRGPYGRPCSDRDAECREVQRAPSLLQDPGG